MILSSVARAIWLPEARANCWAATARIDLIADGDDADLPLVISAAREDGDAETHGRVGRCHTTTLRHHLVQWISSCPPRPAGVPSGFGDVKTENLSVRTGKHEKLAASQLPERFGGILNRERVLRGHYRFERRQFSQHGGGSGKFKLALVLYIFETRAARRRLLCRTPSAISERTVWRTTRSSDPSRAQIITKRGNKKLCA